MALMMCPECQRQVSSLAPTCPHCGVPLAMRAAPAVASAAGPLVAAGSHATGTEEVLWQGTPSLKALVTRILGTVLFAVVVTVVVWAAYPRVLAFMGSAGKEIGAKVGAKLDVDSHRDDARLLAILIVVGVVGVRVMGLGWQIAVLKSQRYRITSQRIVIESGVFSRRIEEIDMRTVEDLEFRQSFLDRVLGIGQIAVISSDRSAGRFVLVGLDRPRELRELIRGGAYQATRGQLFTRAT